MISPEGELLDAPATFGIYNYDLFQVESTVLDAFGIFDILLTARISTGPQAGLTQTMQFRVTVIENLNVFLNTPPTFLIDPPAYLQVIGTEEEWNLDLKFSETYDAEDDKVSINVNLGDLETYL